MVNASGLVNSTRNRGTCFAASFTVSDFLVSVLSNRSLGCGASDDESDILISNRSRLKSSLQIELIAHIARDNMLSIKNNHLV